MVIFDVSEHNIQLIKYIHGRLSFSTETFTQDVIFQLSHTNGKINLCFC